MKRLFLRSVAIARVYTREHERLTPARFDMLVAIDSQEGGILQANVRWQLGVRSPTVSRMVIGLERQGYVRRSVYPLDHRCRWLTLTTRGKQLVDGAQDELTLGPFGEMVARAMVSREPEERAPTERALAEVRTMFTTIRTLTRDTGRLRYPSHHASGERMARYPVEYLSDIPPWMRPQPARPRPTRPADPPPRPSAPR